MGTPRLVWIIDLAAATFPTNWGAPVRCRKLGI